MTVYLVTHQSYQSTELKQACAEGAMVETESRGRRPATYARPLLSSLIGLLTMGFKVVHSL